ncbi:MAG: SWIM zinc finger family protein [Janthinobacterium lividum]
MTDTEELGSWGDALVESMTDWAGPGRIHRGERLHADGAVLQVEVRAGEILGVVATSSSSYECGFEVDEFDEQELVLIGTFLRSIPPSSASTSLLGTLDLVLSARGLPLGPPADPPYAYCSCRDFDEYCKHVLALAMRVADVIDASPWTWLQARGLLVDLPGAAPSPAPEPTPTPTPERTLDDELASYWTGIPQPTLPVAGLPRPAHRERDPGLLREAFLAEFTVRGRSRARSAALAEEAALAVEGLYEELIGEGEGEGAWAPPRQLDRHS